MIGMTIPATLRHDAGAYARCSWCGRYSADRRALDLDAWPCHCGRDHGWCGSFEPPGQDARWSPPDGRAGTTATPDVIYQPSTCLGGVMGTSANEPAVWPVRQAGRLHGGMDGVARHEGPEPPGIRDSD